MWEQRPLDQALAVSTEWSSAEHRGSPGGVSALPVLFPVKTDTKQDPCPLQRRPTCLMCLPAQHVDVTSLGGARAGPATWPSGTLANLLTTLPSTLGISSCPCPFSSPCLSRYLLLTNAGECRRPPTGVATLGPERLGAQARREVACAHSSPLQRAGGRGVLWKQKP